MAKRIKEAVKRAAVKRMESGKSTQAQEAKRAGVTSQSVAYWRGKYGTNGDAPPSSLPTKAGAPKRRVHKPKPKALVPTSYACPHCGGLVEVAA